ncbi:MAG: PTS transporter subunit EIIC [Bacilli bacterium]|nr:PTS transporter subunit EIIC [Bacilli bacterium]
MDAFADKLGRVGAWCGQNKYLLAIKNAFQNYLPATIAGAIAVLWTCVIVNESSGLGIFFKPIMALEPTNTIFNAINTATIGSMAVGVCMLVAQEIADANGEQSGAYPAVLGFMMWLVVTPTSINATDEAGAVVATVSGIPTSYMGATGLFTGLLVGIVGTEIYCKLRKVDALKIKMPEQVPPGVARAFEILVPTVIILVIVGGVSLVVNMLTGLDLNSLVSTYIQAPLSAVMGQNVWGAIFIYIIAQLFWCIGMHGQNMISAVKEPIFTPLIVENMEIFQKTRDITQVPNTLNITMMQMFAEWGGSGVTLSLILVILIFSKREDNRTIAALSVVPGCFNINETMTFGIPLVLNPILDIPFVVAPAVCMFVGYILITIGFCPKIAVQTPWTTPPLLMGFLATGGSIMGAISQLIVFAVAVVIYIPFFLAYERQQNKESAGA